MRFIYDVSKSELNREKHGLSLEEATQLWRAPFVVIEARSVTEPRFMIVGRIGDKCYSGIFTIREDVIRLISARRSRENEEALYYEKIKEDHEG